MRTGKSQSVASIKVGHDYIMRKVGVIEGILVQANLSGGNGHQLIQIRTRTLGFAKS